MMREWIAGLAGLCLTTGCATHTTQAPPSRVAPLSVHSVQLINDSPVSEPRIYFSDGITKYKTDYRGWTQVVVDAYGAQLLRSSTTAGGPSGRAVRFSILGLNCSGHYVADCSMAMQVARSDGVTTVFTTDTYNGWPIDSALRKALDAGVSTALADVPLNTFVGRTSP